MLALALAKPYGVGEAEELYAGVYEEEWEDEDGQVGRRLTLLHSVSSHNTTRCDTRLLLLFIHRGFTHPPPTPPTPPHPPPPPDPRWRPKPR